LLHKHFFGFLNRTSEVRIFQGHQIICGVVRSIRGGFAHSADGTAALFDYLHIGSSTHAQLRDIPADAIRGIRAATIS
jgi:hypothetical protein